MSSSRSGTPHIAGAGKSHKGPRTPRRPRIRPNDNIVEASDSSLTSFERMRLSSPFVDGNLSSPLNFGTPSSMCTTNSVVRNTPLKARPDNPKVKCVLQLNSQSEGTELNYETNQRDLTNVILGTDIVAQRCMAKFKKFILNFVGKYSKDSEPELLYFNNLEKICVIEKPFLNVNCAHIEEYNPDLYRQLVSYPQEVINLFDEAANKLFFKKHPDHVLPHHIQVRPFNTEKTLNMRELKPEDINKLITIYGMVNKTSSIIPEMKEAFFKCNVCDYSRVVEIDCGRFSEPSWCTNCNTSHCFYLIHNRSKFNDKQIIILQEIADDMSPGQIPHMIKLYAYNDLVDFVTPGQRVSVTGIYRAVPILSNPRTRSLNSVFRTYVDVIHISSTCISERDQFKPKRLKQMMVLSKRPDIYERLANAIAPSIFENKDVKKGILLQLFGGARKALRSEIHILLCGDPGTTKSQLLSLVYDLIPRSQYITGKGSSAVGLTAYVVKDPVTRQLVLQIGALAMADNGICCIDELDKMNEATRSVLHEINNKRIET
nr:DNA replication licensing factor MCM4-like [Halyomorpha halys]